jgi:GT2 family glycosyltransferase
MLSVLIGITTQNRCKVLPKAIESALAQTWPNTSIAVYDDHSTDDTQLLKDKYPSVQWVRPDKPVGYRHARNHLMSSTDCELYCSLDDDSWFLAPDALTRGVEMFIAEPKLAALAYHVLDSTCPTTTNHESSLVHCRTFVGCGHILKLSSAKDAGLYHDAPGSYGGEETDLCLRLLDAGYEVKLLKGVHVWHDKTFTSRNAVEQHVSAVRNELWTTYQRAPISVVWWLLPARITNQLRFAIRFGFTGSRHQSAFDIRIKRDCGRWSLFVAYFRAIFLFAGDILRNPFGRSPVSAETFRRFLSR